MKNRLRILRAERNWSQADLAERLEVSRQSVNAIETGKFDPSLPLQFLREDMGVLADELTPDQQTAILAERYSLLRRLDARRNP